jgi:hypothetical protein
MLHGDRGFIIKQCSADTSLQTAVCTNNAIYVIERIYAPEESNIILNAVLDQEGPAQTSWCSKWAVHLYCTAISDSTVRLTHHI